MLSTPCGAWRRAKGHRVLICQLPQRKPCQVKKSSNSEVGSFKTHMFKTERGQGVESGETEPKQRPQANPSGHYQDANCSAASTPANQLLKGGFQQGLWATEECRGILVPCWSTGTLRHIGGKTELHICVESASRGSEPASRESSHYHDH